VPSAVRVAPGSNARIGPSASFVQRGSGAFSAALHPAPWQLASAASRSDCWATNLEGAIKWTFTSWFGSCSKSKSSRSPVSYSTYVWLRQRNPL